MKNPVEAAREEQRLGRTEFARRHNLSYFSVQALELGRTRRLHSETKTTFAKACGKTPKEFEAEYNAWRRQV